MFPRCSWAVKIAGSSGARGIAEGVQTAPPTIGPVTITREEVAHLARLARVAVTDEELAKLALELDVILDAVKRVGEVSSADVPPTSHAVPLTNVFRTDAVRPSLDRDEVLSQAPAAEDGRFRVPRILDED